MASGERAVCNPRLVGHRASGKPCQSKAESATLGVMVAVCRSRTDDGVPTYPHALFGPKKAWIHLTRATEGFRSSGLVTPRPGVFRTCVSIIVVLTSL